jgi:hypothetical protein
MSLLLEALKKAEKAKEEAQRRARGEGGAAVLRMDGEPEPRAVVTRAELPDIKQPLEILSDDIAPREAPPADKAAGAVASAPSRAAQSQADERAAARKVFEAKFKEPNPRLPFFVTLGVLGAFALGTVGYFWYQLRPPPSLVNVSPARGGSEAPVQVAAAQPAPPVAQATATTAIPGLPAAAAPAALAAPAPKPAAPAPRIEAPKPAARIVRPAELAPLPQQTVSTSRPAPPQVHPGVQAGYAAYLKGDLAAARDNYAGALREDSSNRDALLGLAAVDTRSGRLEAAEATYLRLLQSNPGDAHAQAGLIALRAGRLDPLATESRLKSMLAAAPEANVLHFTLGNQLARQGRWQEAQQAYFKAFAASPDNADFAYNLAVSLDQLRQGKLALEYYGRAIALAEARGASFDVAAARTRAAQLGR